MEENNLFERLFIMRTKDLFEFNKICLIQKISLGQINICLNKLNISSKITN